LIGCKRHYVYVNNTSYSYLRDLKLLRQ